MVGMLCHFYGWTVTECLDLPVRTFFAMHKQAVQMEIRQYAELADIALIPHQQTDYYFKLKEKYQAMLTPGASRLPDRPPGPVIEAGSADARTMLEGVVMRKKQFMGLNGRRRQ